MGFLALKKKRDVCVCDGASRTRTTGTRGATRFENQIFEKING